MLDDAQTVPKAERPSQPALLVALGATLPAVGVGTLFTTLGLGLVPVLPAWLPSSASNTGSGAIGSFLSLSVELGNHLLRPVGGYFIVVLAGLAVGLYANTGKWWTRLGASVLAGALGGLLALLGVTAGWLVGTDALWWLAPVLAAIGGCLSISVRRWTQTWPTWILFGVPRWVGSARAIVWIPIVSALAILATYVGTGLLILALLLLTFYVAYRVLLLVTGNAGPSRAKSLFAVPASAARSEPAGDKSPVYYKDSQGNYAGMSKPGTGLFGGGDSTWHYDKAGNLTGHTTKDGRRYDAQGNFIGTSRRVETPWGPATELRDADGSTTGYVRDDGVIVDASGNSTGSADK